MVLAYYGTEYSGEIYARFSQNGPAVLVDLPDWIEGEVKFIVYFLVD